MLTRRGLLTGLIGVLATPAVIKSDILMPVKTPFFTPPSRVALNYPIQALSQELSSRIEISHDGGFNWKVLEEEDIEDHRTVKSYIELLRSGDNVVLRGTNQLRRNIGDKHGTA